MTQPNLTAGNYAERDVIEEAAAAIEAKLRLYGSPAVGSIGWGASVRELAEAAYPVIAAAVRAQVADELHEMAQLLPRAEQAQFISTWLVKAFGALAAPVDAPSLPEWSNHYHCYMNGLAPIRKH